MAIAPGSIQPHKSWPLDKWTAIAAMLAAEGHHVLVMGTDIDAALAPAIASAIPGRCTVLAGMTSVSEAAAVLARCELLIANDGGIVHLASAVGCRCVSVITGIEYPGSVEPFNDRDHAVRVDVPCAPCYSFESCPSGTLACTRQVPVEAVASHARHQLRRGRGVHAAAS